MTRRIVGNPAREGTANVAQIALDVCGLRIAVSGDWPEVVESVRLDFACFPDRDPGRRPHVEARVERGSPDFDSRRLTLGYDHEPNWAALLPLLR